MPIYDDDDPRFASGPGGFQRSAMESVDLFNTTKYQDEAAAGSVQDIETQALDESGQPIGDPLTLQSNRVTGYRPIFADASDAYANGKQMFVSIQHVPSQQYVMFKAFITAFNENYKCNWSGESVFGRIDPIYSYKSTDRNITLNLNIPASSEGEAFENLAKIGLLSDMLYPNYTNTGQANTISQSPLIRLKVMNLLQSQKSMWSAARQSQASGMTFDNLKYGHNSSAAKGQLGVITSLQINHNIDNPDVGVFEMGMNTILPSFIDISIGFDVIHEVPRGWNADGRQYHGGPYGLDPRSGTKNPYRTAVEIDTANRGAYNANQQEVQRLEAEDDRELAQQTLENDRARNFNLLGGMRSRQALREHAGATRKEARIFHRAARNDGVIRTNYDSDEQYIDAARTWADAPTDSE